MHGDKYNYSLVKYIKSNIKVKIYCKKCEKYFEQTPLAHMRGHGCVDCVNNEQRSNKEEFIIKSKQIHGDNLFNYDLVEYKNNKTKVKLKCNKCNIFFEQKPSAHIKLKHGCPHCKSSRSEKRIKIILNNKNVKYIYQKKFDDCKDKLSLPFDFYLPDYNMCIEYDGIHHFYPHKYWGGEEKLKYTINHDIIKTKYCEENNIKLLRIKYDEIIEEKLNKHL